MCLCIWKPTGTDENVAQSFWLFYMLLTPECQVKSNLIILYALTARMNATW